ncbi:hypothetical protein [Oleiphilus sp. HI0123]
MIKRILFLEGHPDLATREPLNVGKQFRKCYRMT